MQRPVGLRVALLIGVVAFIAPIWLSLALAWKQSQSYEQANVHSYAVDVLRRGDETRREFGVVLKKIKEANLSPCSPAEINLMRGLDLSSSYIQAVGRIEGDQLLCTSQGVQGPIQLGPPTLVTESAVAERLQVILPTVENYPLDVISADGVAIIIDPMLLIDTPLEGTDISLALYVPSSASHNILASRGKRISPSLFAAIVKGGEVSYTNDEYIVSAVRSASADFAVVATAPKSYVDRRVRRFALIFVPVGLLCGLGMAWAVKYISQTQLTYAAVMRGAAKRKEFFVEYQPVIELSSGRCIGAEALVRWNQNGELIRPDQFIPEAEESGVITEITQCVLSIVGTDLRSLIAIDTNFRVGINLSAPDLKDKIVLDGLRNLLAKSGAQTTNLEIEITERSFLQGAEVTELLTEMHSLGFRIAIDDFGTGYSSLSCLQTLPVTTLKIDKSFIDTIGTDGVTSQVVTHIIDMAHSLHLDMVAEGVEREEQALFVRGHGVLYAQGWLFGRPMDLASLHAFLRVQATRVTSSINTYS